MAYVPKAILFDGTTDSMTRGTDLVGLLDGPLGLFNVWFRIDGGNGTIRAFFGIFANVFRVELGTANELFLRGAGPGLVELTHSLNLQPGPNWFHYLASWDTNADIANAYLNDTTQADITVIQPGNIDYTGDSSVAVGNRGQPAATTRFFGALADLYFLDEFLDLDVEANRRNFIDASGNPVFLGTAGERPTGTDAVVYQRGELTDQGLNSGSGGDFTSQATQVPNETTGPVDDAIATLLGVGGLRVVTVVIPNIPNEEAPVCDPALDSASPGSGSLPRSWDGLGLATESDPPGGDRTVPRSWNGL